MDEKKLAELLKDAVADTPPPTFTHADVTRESDRQRARRRNGLLAGSAFGVAVLAGATALGVALWTGQGPSEVTSAENAASSGNGNAAPYELPNEGGEATDPTERGQAQDSPSESRKQGRTSTGDGGPAGSTGTPSGCEQADRELAAALAGELPAAAQVDSADAVAVTLYCDEDFRGAAFDLPDGRISVLLLSGDERALTSADTAGTQSAQAIAPTEDGRLVVVVSEPSSQGGSAPYGTDLSRYATEIAADY